MTSEAAYKMYLKTITASVQSTGPTGGFWNAF